MQTRILEDAAPVRIFSAPTGAGKSHALIKAAEGGKRVLFIVPTRRLAQNLAEDAARALGEGAVALWSSDETKRQRELDPAHRPWRSRMVQVQGGGGTRFIVATPESVAGMLLGHASSGAGADPLGPADLVQEFDHIVFDEFHTIDPRGFGLCALVARLCVVAETGPRVTFLSATPIAILPVLVALDVPAASVAIGSETVREDLQHADDPDLRVLHGDVRLIFASETNLVSLLTEAEPEIRACLDRDSQLVVVLDSLAELQAERHALAEFFESIGVPAARRLAISSIDDSATGAQDGLFVADRHADPRAFDVLVATSAIEMGVTFRAGMIVMDPGHDAGSFVQRFGRVARGDEPGLVVVRPDRRGNGKRPWLRLLPGELGCTPEGTTITVSRFLKVALGTARKRFDVDRDVLESDELPAAFRAMPQRAVWAACLFFHALDRSAPRWLAGQREALRRLAPGKTGSIAKFLRAVGEGETNFCGREWARSFLAQAGTLRDIAAGVKVQEPERRIGVIPLAFLDRYPVLSTYPLIADEEGGWTLVLDRPLHALLRNAESRSVEQRRVVMLPDGQDLTVETKEAANQAVAEMKARAGKPGTTAAQRARLEAAIALVRLSGLIPDKATFSASGAAVL